MAVASVANVGASATLDLGVIGNGSFAALIEARGRVVWGCVPAFDGDPTFCALLSPLAHDGGYYEIELEDFASSVQHYLKNTAVLRTILRDSSGGAIEITDRAALAPERALLPSGDAPAAGAPAAGSPRIRVHLRPLADYGAQVPETTWGSNHIRYLVPSYTMRLTSDVPVRMVREELPFVLDSELHLVLGPDETLTDPLAAFVRQAEERTIAYCAVSRAAGDRQGSPASTRNASQSTPRRARA